MSSIYLEPAGLIRRFIAFLIDGLLISLVAFLYSGLLSLILLLTDVNLPEQLWWSLVLHDSTLPIMFIGLFGFVLASLPPILYYTYFTSSFRQASLGQRLMNMYIVRLDQVKIKAGFALMRCLVYIFLPFIIGLILFAIKYTPIVVFFDESVLGIMLLIFFIVWCITPIFSDKNQMIHDILCKTIVVKGRLKKAN